MVDSVVIGGLGVVGKATILAFGIKDYYDLRGSNTDFKEIAENKRYIFICLPTPTIGGRCFTEDIENTIRQILSYGGQQKIFIIRSTISPGTTRNLIEKLGTHAIVHNPEFLTASTWEQDALHPDIVVIGGEQANYIEDVEALYKSRFKGVDIFTTDSLTSETVKYAINSFYAMKVVFANQIFDFCQKFGVNYEKIREIMYKRKWIGNNHLRIFDEQGKRGVDGKCLPKDLEAFISCSGSPLLELVQKLNKGYVK